MKFSTKDQDNDRWSDNCATLDKGGWWYSACEYCNLNAEYGKSSPAWRYDLHGLVNNSLMMVTKV